MSMIYGFSESRETWRERPESVSSKGRGSEPNPLKGQLPLQSSFAFLAGNWRPWVIFKNAEMSALLLLLVAMPFLPSDVGPSILTPKFLYHRQLGAQGRLPQLRFRDSRGLRAWAGPRILSYSRSTRTL